MCVAELHYGKLCNFNLLSITSPNVAKSFYSALEQSGSISHRQRAREGPKEKGEDLRTFYWDASKPLPEIKPGEMLRVTSHGGFVIGWQRV